MVYEGFSILVSGFFVYGLLFYVFVEILEVGVSFYIMEKFMVDGVVNIINI